MKQANCNSKHGLKLSEFRRLKVSNADSANAQLKTLLIDNGLSAALDGVNINKDLKAGAVAMLQAGATITEGKAMIGDKSLSDAVNEWSQTDAGKAFCLAAK